MTSEPAPELPQDACPNCEAALHGPYCAHCGQHQLDLERPLGQLLAEAMSSFLAFDSRLLRTFSLLVRHPGELTVEYMRGRRARYAHPLRMYLALSLLLFLVLSLTGYSMVQVGNPGDGVITLDSQKAPEVVASEEDAAPQDPATEEPAGDVFARILSRLDRLSMENPASLNRSFTDRLATTVIVLVPVFAALLRLLYWSSPYVAHLVFSLHLHSFGFLVILTGIAIDRAMGMTEGGPGGGLAGIALLVYTFFALRRVHGQGRAVTALKLVFLLFAYLLAVVATMIATLIVVLFTA